MLIERAHISRPLHQSAAVLVASLVILGISSGAAAQERLKGRLAISTHTLAHAPTYLARGLNFFEREGINIEVQVVSGVVAAQALSGGSVEFNVDSPSTLARMVERGLDVLNVQGEVSSLSMNLIVRREVAQRKQVTPQSPLEARLQALRGLTIGITTPGAAGDAYTRILLKQAGIDPLRDANIVQIGSADGLLAALKTAKIDAFMLSAPNPEKGEKEGFGVILIRNSAGDVPIFRQFMHTSLSVRREYARANPEAVRRTTRAIARGINLILDQPEEAKRALLRDFKVEPDLLSRSMDNLAPAYRRNGRMDEETWRKTIEVFVQGGVISKPLDPREGVFWTNEYLP